MMKASRHPLAISLPERDSACFRKALVWLLAHKVTLLRSC
jgi:hypothetical protein